jgi:OTU domain-containing protein 6
MGGSKRAKLKKALSPPSSAPPPPELAANDEDLMEDLFSQLDSRDTTVQLESAQVIQEIEGNQQALIEDTSSKKSSKSRHTARLARKAAALVETLSPDDPDQNARLEKEAKQEEEDISKVCKELGLNIHEINPDGHCLFSAVADQLALLSILPPAQATYRTTRLAASNYIFSHPDDFLPFLPSVEGEDGVHATDTGLMSPLGFEKYCAAIRDTGVWGGEPEILALSRAYHVPIHVVQGGRPPIVVHEPQEPSFTQAIVRISYHRRMYGLGEHYNSLRPKQSLLPM